MMMALGCVQSKHCNTNNCPTGIATQDANRSKAIDVQSKSERVKFFQHNTLKSFYELVGSMGLTDPATLTPTMIKRRSTNGVVTCGSVVPPLDKNAIIDGIAGDIWGTWWQSASENDFYVYDNVVIKPIEIKNI